jgi:hypothetical protein
MTLDKEETMKESVEHGITKPKSNFDKISLKKGNSRHL